jgi:hypothetical protein
MTQSGHSGLFSAIAGAAAVDLRSAIVRIDMGRQTELGEVLEIPHISKRVDLYRSVGVEGAVTRSYGCADQPATVAAVAGFSQKKIIMPAYDEVGAFARALSRPIVGEYRCGFLPRGFTIHEKQEVGLAPNCI